MHGFIRFVLVAGLIVCSMVQAEPTDLDMAVQKLLTAGAAGFTLATIDDNGIRWSAARGYADVSQQKPMTVDTIMNVASISKTVTGTALMMLVEQGKLELDRDVNEYLPFTVRHPAYPDIPITTRQLLTHSSAIQDREAIYYSETVYFPGADNPISLGVFVQAYLSVDGRYYAPDNFADYPPGVQSRYSNVAYGLAGYLVEVVSGKPLNQFSAEKIFKPLGMHSTGWMLSEIDPDQHASLYEWTGAGSITVEWYGLATWPDGGMRTSVRDLSRFFAAMIGGGELQGTRIMQQATVTTMFQPQFVAGQVLEVVEEEENHQQAITWAYRTGQSGKTAVGHSGGDPGVTTHAYFFPDAGVGAILLVNTSSEAEGFNLAVQELIRTLLRTSIEESGS